MRVTEIFKTIQGEGILSGTVSVIVRLWGCNLKCKWCDEQFSLRPGTSYELSIKGMLEEIRGYNCENVMITGGEPLIHQGIVALTNELKDNNYHVTIETNATIQKNVNCNLISMSPKLSHSIPDNVSDIRRYDEKRIKINVIRYYIKNYDYQIKFVVGCEKDFDEIEEILLKVGSHDRSKVLIMPLASSRRQLFRIQKEIVAMCIERNWRYANRLQLQVWGQNKEIKR